MNLLLLQVENAARITGADPSMPSQTTQMNLSNAIKSNPTSKLFIVSRIRCIGTGWATATAPVRRAASPIRRSRYVLLV